MIATSPPYFGLRDYGVADQLGLEPLHDCLAWAKGGEPCGRCFVCDLRLVARELWRVLRDDGTMWLNLGDSYARSPKKGGSGPGGKEQDWYGDNYGAARGAEIPEGMKQKDLMGVPWRVALALQADGWTLRSDVIWSKPNPMPESVTDRPTKAHEYVFLFSKRAKYFYDHHAVKEPLAEESWGRMDRKERLMERTGTGTLGKQIKNGVNGDHAYAGLALDRNGKTGYDVSGRNARTVWNVATKPYPGSHFATWPPDLVEPMIEASTSEAGVCSACGRQWVRVVTRGEVVPIPGNPNPVKEYAAASGHSNGQGKTTLHRTRPVIESSFEPACACGCSPVPAVVLDPFAGSGTTLMVARRLGRAGIGLDLSLPYLLEQARPRLLKESLPLPEISGGVLNSLEHHQRQTRLPLGF